MRVINKLMLAVTVAIVLQSCGSSTKKDESAAKTPHERNALEEYVRAPIDKANAVKESAAGREAEMEEQMGLGDE